MEYAIAIKINDLLRHTARWMNVIIIMLSERNPTKKLSILYNFIYIKS